MKAWSQFFPDILAEVPGCPDSMLERALLRASQEFCAGTMAWKVWLSDTVTVLNTVEYDIEFESNSELIRLERATLDGRPLQMATADDLPNDWMTNSASIAPCVFTNDRKTLALLPPPAANLVLRVEASLKPANNAAGVEDFLFDNYVDTIAMGAMAKLMQKSNVPFSNPAKGMELDRQFTYELARIGFQKDRGFSSHMSRAKVRTF